MKPSKFLRVLACTCAVALFSLPAVSNAEDLPQMTGEHWTKSSRDVKRAYLIGLNNLIDAEYAYQMKFAKPRPTTRQTLIQRMYEAGDGSTIDGAIATVDAWYRANPDKKGKAILDVLWLEYVKKDS